MTKKLLFIFSLLLFHFSFVQAQDTLVFRNGRKIVGTVVSISKKKVVYTRPPDTAQKVVPPWRLEYVRYSGGTQYNFNQPFEKKQFNPSPSEFYLSVDGGFSVPYISYRDAIVGTHFDIKATYFFNRHVGIMAKAAEDLNATGLDYIADSYWGGFYIFKQYLAGFCYRAGGKPGFPWIHFMALLGPCTASNPMDEEGDGNKGITVTAPGSASGWGGYLGIEFISSSNHFCSITFGVGCLGTRFKYSDYTNTYSLYNPYTQVTNNTVSKSVSTNTMLLPQMYVGINFRLKKATK